MPPISMPQAQAAASAASIPPIPQPPQVPAGVPQVPIPQGPFVVPAGPPQPVYPVPKPPVVVQAGLVPKLPLPPFILVVAFIAFLWLIAEIDGMGRHAAKVTETYTGRGGGNVLQKLIVAVSIAGAIGLCYSIS